MRRDIFRIIDANLNRSREGLRVCEEVARFAVKSPPLTRSLKDVRHAITTVIRAMPERPALIERRNAAGDIGRCRALESTTARSDIADIYFANMERVKEALRVLEEFTKVIDAAYATRFKALRFKVYGIEKRSYRRVSALRDPR